jgi:hypothetical protein
MTLKISLLRRRNIMRTFINLLVVVSLVSLTGCIPGLFGAAGGKASFQYSGPSGDTTGFALTPFDTSQISANRFDATMLIAIQANQDVLHSMFLTLQGQLVPGFTCPLKQGSFGGASANGCTLAYQQSASDGSNALQSTVTSGAVTVTAFDGSSLSFNFEATLQTPAGGSFTLQGSGSTSIQTN